MGTTHKVNNLIIQNLQGSFGNATQHLASLPKWKRNRRSCTPQFATIDYSNYRQTKPTGPSPKQYSENKASEFMMDDVNKRHFLWCLMRYNSIDSFVPSWTCFQILMCGKIPDLKSNIAYLGCIDAPATKISTIYQVN